MERSFSIAAWELSTCTCLAIHGLNASRAPGADLAPGGFAGGGAGVGSKQGRIGSIGFSTHGAMP